MITFSKVPSNATASGVFIENEYIRSSVPGAFQQRVAVLGQYNSGFTPSNDSPYAATSSAQVASLFGHGSSLHRMSIKIFDNLGLSGVFVDFFPLAAGTGASTSSVTVTGTATSSGKISLYVAGDRVSVSVDAGAGEAAIASAINSAITSNISLPVTSSVSSNVVTLTSKNVGLSQNQITVKQNLEIGDSDLSPSGISVVITAMTGGTADPSISTALSNFSNTFYTVVACPFNSDTTLDVLEAFGETRISPEVKKPFIGIVGYADTRENLLTFLDSRNSPWTTVFPVSGSPTPPCEIAAAVVGVVASSSQSEPARPFKNLPVLSISPGALSEWSYTEKNQIELSGGSVSYVDSSGIVRIGDLVTTYTKTPLGADDDAWRFTVTISNIQVKISSIDSMFLSPPFDRAVIVDDASVTGKEFAVSPKRVKSYIIDLIDRLWIPQAWSKNRDSIVAGVQVEIDAQNPGRLNVLIPDVLAVGLRVVAVKYQWSFSV